MNIDQPRRRHAPRHHRYPGLPRIDKILAIKQACRRIAIATAVVHAVNMAIAYTIGDAAAFAICWAGAVAGACGWLYFQEDEQDMNRYRDLAMRLRWEIKEEDAYQPGHPLPTIRAIAQRFNASRTTARRALDVLAAEGLVDIHPGKGAFVAGGNGRGSSRSAHVEHHLRQQVAMGMHVDRTEAIALAWQISPSTARRIVRQLVDEGLIRRRRDGSFEAA